LVRVKAASGAKRHATETLVARWVVEQNIGKPSGKIKKGSPKLAAAILEAVSSALGVSEGEG
jgi:hypothetical protein